MKYFIIEPHINYTSFSYYSTFVNELCKNENTVVSTDTKSLNEFCLKSDKSDCIFLGLGFFDNPKSFCNNYFTSFAESDALKVAYIHKVKNEYQEKINFCKAHKVDLILTSTPLAEEIQQDSGIPTFTLPYGANPEAFYTNSNIEKKYDISFSGAMHENKHGVPDELKNIRFKARDIIKERKDLSVFWNGSDNPSQSYRMSQIEYVEKLNQSKIWYAATGPAWDMNPRHSEILFCGAVLLTNETPNGYYDQWEDGFNCVRYKTDLSNLNQKIDEALKKQEIITKNAYNFASENLTPNKIYERFKWITKQISKKL
jgi:hypothetical protein